VPHLVRIHRKSDLDAWNTYAIVGEFTSIRQDVILKIAEIVEASGTRFAAPTQLAYLSRDKGIDAEKATGESNRYCASRGRAPGQRRVQIPR
jgi:MscS family membrane protein